MKRLLFALLLITVPALASDVTSNSVLQAMNLRRIAANLPPLRLDPRLDAAAGDRMRDMAERGYWAHQSPAGLSPFSWLPVHGYFLRAAGENLATGFETTELLTAGWMESPGHRANIMAPDFADCGIAIIDGATTRRAAGRSIVVLFGSAEAFSVAGTTPRSRP